MEKNLSLQRMLESPIPHSASTSFRERGSAMEERVGGIGPGSLKRRRGR